LRKYLTSLKNDEINTLLAGNRLQYRKDFTLLWHPTHQSEITLKIRGLSINYFRYLVTLDIMNSNIG
jgi:hypothetical protein